MAQLAAGEVYPVRAYYVYPSDQPYHQEYVDAINTYLDELRGWDATHTAIASPTSLSATSLTVQVPSGVGPGYIRVRNGGGASNKVPVNFHP